MYRRYLILALALTNIILVVTVSSVQNAYSQPDLWIDSVHGNRIYDKPAIFKLGVTNGGNATAKEIKVGFVSVNDTLKFTAKTPIVKDSLEPKERIDLEYEVIGKALGLQEYYITLSWEDTDGTKYTKDTKKDPYGYTVFQVIETQTDSNLSMILIGAGVSVVAGMGIIFFIKRNQQSKITET